jgi:outer membrane protein OmpA-like peptidoglycan-associated protein
MGYARRGSWSVLALAIASASFVLTGGPAGAAVVTSTPISADAISSLNCPTSAFCAAGDAGGALYTEVSGTWSTATIVDMGSAIDALSCTSAAFCMAGDTNGNVYVFNGATWSVGSQPDGSSINGISCSATWCAAVTDNGNALASVDNGLTWSMLGGGSPDGAPLLAVSCSSATWCVVSDNQGVAFEYAGGPWLGPLGLSSNEVTGISCVSSSFCLAVDSDSNVFEYDGANWTRDAQDPVTTQSPSEISCTSSSFCLLGDGSGNVFVDNDGTWSADPTNPVDLAGTITSVSCASATSCTLGDWVGNVLTYTMPGAPRSPVVLRAQSPLAVTSVSGVVGTGLPLSTSGGSGTGAVSFVVESAGSAGCVVSSADVLSATAPGTCSVSAIKSSDGVYASATSPVATVTFVSAVSPTPPVRRVTSRTFVVGPFANGSAHLGQALRAQTSRIFAALVRGGYRTLIVTGYASAIGTHSHNIALSRIRAQVVTAMLREDFATKHYRVSLSFRGAGVGPAERAAANRVVDVTARDR